MVTMAQLLAEALVNNPTLNNGENKSRPAQDGVLGDQCEFSKPSQNR